MAVKPAALQRIEDRIEAQQKALEQLRAQRQKLHALERARLNGMERKKDTRRKVLAGAMTLEMMAESEDARKRILARLDQFLSRDDDRALFDLPPLARDQDQKSSDTRAAA